MNSEEHIWPVNRGPEPKEEAKVEVPFSEAQLWVHLLNLRRGASVPRLDSKDIVMPIMDVLNIIRVKYSVEEEKASAPLGIPLRIFEYKFEDGSEMYIWFQPAKGRNGEWIAGDWSEFVSAGVG